MQSLTKSNQGTELIKHQLKEQTKHLLASLESSDRFAKARNISSLTPDKAIEGTQVSIVKTEIGEERTAKIIFSLLDELRIALSIEKTNESDIRLIDASMRIMNEFFFLKLEEIVLCIHRCKEGRYGKSYGKLSIENIFEWFDKFDAERIGRIDAEHEHTKHAIANPADRSPEPKLAKDIFEQSVDQKVKQRIDAYKNKAENG